MARILSVSGYDRRVGALFAPDTALALRVEVAGEAESPLPLVLDWSLTDLFGQVLEGKADVGVPGTRPCTTELAIPLTEPGAFDLEVRLADVTYGTRDTFCEKLAVLEQPTPVPPEANPFGVNLGAHTPEGLDMMFRVCRRTGIGWGALWNTLWFRCEKTQDEFDFTEMDAVMEVVGAGGVRVMGVLGLAPAWAIEEDADGLMVPRPERWEIYVRRIVSRYKDSIKHWQLWNEPDIRGFGPWEDHPETCADLLKLAYPIIKEIDPEACVLSPGIQGCKVNWARRYFDAGGADACDIGSTHAYWGPDWQSVGAIMADLQRRRGGSRWWITEMGKALEDRRQAQFLVRNYLRAFELGAEKVFWHCVSQGEDPYAIYERYNPDGGKPSGDDVGAYGRIRTGLVAMAVLARLLTGSAFAGRDDRGKAVVYVFRRPDGRTLHAAWALARPEVVELPAHGECEVIDMVGRRETMRAGPRGLSVAATADPIYVVSGP